MARIADPGTRPALLKAARELFYSGGIAATSVDDIADRSGLTKPTVYRHFPSKDSLVGEYLSDRHDQLNAELRSWIEAARPALRPRAVIDWLCDWLQRPGFRGCAFVRALAEVPSDKEIRLVAQQRKQALLNAIADACQTSGIAAPDSVARQLFLIVEGATTMAYVSGDPQLASDTARALADLVLRRSSFGSVGG